MATKQTCKSCGSCNLHRLGDAKYPITVQCIDCGIKGPKELKTYIFTFGAHKDPNGNSLVGCYVTVLAYTEAAARKAFIKKFAIPVMKDPSKWAFCYAEKSFERIKASYKAEIVEFNAYD